MYIYDFKLKPFKDPTQASLHYKTQENVRKIVVTRHILAQLGFLQWPTTATQNNYSTLVKVIRDHRHIQ